MEYERVFCGTRSVNLADKNQCKLKEKKKITLDNNYEFRYQ